MKEIIKKLKNKIIIGNIITIGITIIVIKLLLPIIGQEVIEVTFESQANKNITYQLFYTSMPNEKFNGQKSLQQQVKAGKQSVKFSVPTQNMEQLRIDFGQVPEKASISHLRVNGKEIKALEFKNIINYHQIEKHEITNNQLTIYSREGDPFVIFPKNLNIKPVYQINCYLFSILLILVYFTLNGIIKYLLNMKKGKINYIDLIFILCFFGSLFIPMMNISEEKESAQENRTLAIKPKMEEIIKGKSDFGKRFENWFNDHFFGREELLGLNKKFQLMNQYIVADKTFEGKDNWFFYRLDESIPNFLNISVYSEEEIKKGVTYLEKFHEWAERNGKKFYYVVPPEKNKIYGEYIATLNKRKPDSESRTRKFFKVLNEKTNVKNIYLYDVMMAHKKENNLLYWKNDTHWNALGAYYGYVAIMEMIKKDFPDIETIGPFPLKEEKFEKGGLTRLGYLPTDQKTVYHVPDFKSISKCKPYTFGQASNKESPLPIVCEGGKYPLKVLIFGDSFTGYFLSTYLNNTFSQVKNIWHHYNLPKEVLPDLNEADIIIVETHERMLRSIFKPFPHL